MAGGDNAQGQRHSSETISVHEGTSTARTLQPWTHLETRGKEYQHGDEPNPKCPRRVQTSMHMQSVSIGQENKAEAW